LASFIKSLQFIYKSVFKNGKWDAYGLNGIVIKGEARKIAPLQLQSKQPAFILTQNNDSVRVVTWP